MIFRLIALGALVLLLQAETSCWAEDTAAAPVPPAVQADAAAAISTPAIVRIPAGTSVNVELVDALSSETTLPMMHFALRLVDPIVIDGHELAPAGLLGDGEVIDAVPSGMGGRQGRLITSGRYLDFNGQHVRIRGLQWGAAGTDRSNAALGVSFFAGAAGFLVQGGEVHMPAGTRGVARLAVDVDLPATPNVTAAPEIPSTPQAAPSIAVTRVRWMSAALAAL